MRFRTYCGALAVAAAIVATPGSAFAASTPSDGWDHAFTATGVKVYVEEYGDVVRVCDTSANGVAARATLWVSSQLQYEITAGGSGSCSTARASDGDWWNLPEGEVIDISYDGNGGAYASAQYLNDH